MANKVFVLDLDGTCMNTLDLYRKPIARAASLIIETLGGKAPSEHEIRIRHNKLQKAMIYENNPQTKRPYYYTKPRFPTSLVRMYKILCEEAGIKVNEKIAKQIFRIGFGVFNKKRYLRKIMPSLLPLCKFLKKRGDIIIILTKGDKEVQGDKREALRKAGVLKYCDSRYFSDGFIIVEDDKESKFREIRKKYGTDKIYYTIGDTYFDDIDLALKYKYFGIYIQSSFNWKEVGKLKEINRRRNKKRSNKYRDLSEVRRKYEYL